MGDPGHSGVDVDARLRIGAGDGRRPTGVAIS